MNNYKDKCEKLKQAMARYAQKDCIVAFSGGADSSLILKLACHMAQQQGTKVYAVTIHTSLHPMNDLAVAAQVAKEVGALHRVIQVDEIRDAGIENNPPDRCYRCKKYLFQNLLKLAGELQVETILEGTNADDLLEYRPGIRALRELNITSPLADASMTKKEVRMLAEEYGISVAKRPSAPCLATRFPYGTPLSMELMKKIEESEHFVRSEGFYNVRLRIHNDIVRIEVDAEELPRLIEKRERLLSFLKDRGFVYVTVDLEGFRSGSMDVGHNQSEEIEQYWTRRAPSYSDEVKRELKAGNDQAWVEAIRTYLPKHKGLKILDAGTGPGFLAIALSKEGHEVTAVDCTAAMLRQAKDNAGALGEAITFRQMDAQNLDFENETFDVVISRDLTWNLEKPQQAYLEWYRVLKKNGVMLNFDAGWYGYLFDKTKATQFQQDRKNVASQGLPELNDYEDAARMELIARELVLSRCLRPDADLDMLIRAGFKQTGVDKEIWKSVWDEVQQVNNASTPCFLLYAIK